MKDHRRFYRIFNRFVSFYEKNEQLRRAEAKVPMIIAFTDNNTSQFLKCSQEVEIYFAVTSVNGEKTGWIEFELNELDSNIAKVDLEVFLIVYKEMKSFLEKLKPYKMNKKIRRLKKMLKRQKSNTII